MRVHVRGDAKGDEPTEPRRVLLPVKEEEEEAVAKECKEHSQRRENDCGLCPSEPRGYVGVVLCH